METFVYKTVTVDCKDMEHSQDTLTAQSNRWGKEGRMEGALFLFLNKRNGE